MKYQKWDKVLDSDLSVDSEEKDQDEFPEEALTDELGLMKTIRKYRTNTREIVSKSVTERMLFGVHQKYSLLETPNQLYRFRENLKVTEQEEDQA